MFVAIPKAVKLISRFMTVSLQGAATIRSRFIRALSPVIEFGIGGSTVVANFFTCTERRDTLLTNSPRESYPLYPRKRTCAVQLSMSALGQ